MNKITLLYRIAFLASFSFASGAVLAAAPTAGNDEALPSYETLDRNNDGVVTLPEVVVYSKALAQRIKPCDVSGDNKLSRQELAACKLHDSKNSPGH